MLDGKRRGRPSPRASASTSSASVDQETHSPSLPPSASSFTCENCGPSCSCVSSGWLAQSLRLVHELLVTVTSDVLWRAQVLAKESGLMQDLERWILDMNNANQQMESVAKSQKQQQAEEQQAMELELTRAIQHARRLRTRQRDGTGDDTTQLEDQGHEKEQQLQAILQAAATATTDSEQAQSNHAPITAKGKKRIDYPREMRADLQKWHDIKQNQAQGTCSRHIFMLKMTQQLSHKQLLETMSSANPSTNDNNGSPPHLKIQVGFPVQLTRLQANLQRLHTYLVRHFGDDPTPDNSNASATLQQALTNPTLLRVFAMRTRLKHANEMMHQVQQQVDEFAHRVPPPLRLSEAARSLLDADLSRIRPKESANKHFNNSANIDNHHLIMQSASWLDPNSKALLRRLQFAWEHTVAAVATECPPSVSSNSKAAREPPKTRQQHTSRTHTNDCYERLIKQVILNVVADLTVLIFKQVQMDHSESSRAAAQANTVNSTSLVINQHQQQRRQLLLRLVRLMDSMALFNGRHMRSVVPNALT